MDSSASSDWTTAAQGFAAMGSQPRLQVLRTLIRAGEAGLSVSDIQNRTDLAPSTLAHHLKTLTDAGLVEQQRSGRTTLNRARFDLLEQLATFILHECCADTTQEAANDG